MNPQRILITTCAACAALLPASLLAQLTQPQLVPVPPVLRTSGVQPVGPITAYQPGVIMSPPVVSGPPIVSAQPQFAPQGQVTNPGIQNYSAPPPGNFGGPVYDPYYQPLPSNNNPPVGGFGGPILPGGNNWNTFGSTAGITPRAGGGTLIGEDVGLDDGFTWLQGFAPIFQTPGQSITFIDGRALKYHENSDAFGYNLALGHRWYSPTHNRVFGAYIGYDYRNNGAFDFDQISFGAESLGCLWDFRANGYLLLSDDTQFVNFTNQAFQGMNLVATANFIDAFDGFDVEAGRNITPGNPTLDVRVFGGGYGFFSNGSRDAYGVRGRIEATWWDRVSLGASVQYDEVFDTTVYGTLSILFGGANHANNCGCPTIADRLGDPLHKNMHVVLNRRAQQNVVINDPADNMALTFLHVDSNAAAGGDGSFEMPFNTLTAAEAANNANVDIVLAHAGSVFTAEDFVVGFADQRLLGDSAAVTHTTPSQFGTVAIPRANGLAARPQVDLAPADAVTIAANNVEVSGLNITNAVDDGIFGNNVTGVNINNNVINTFGGNGVNLDGTVSGLIQDNVAMGGTVVGVSDGFEISTFSSGTISGNTASNNGGDGFDISTFTDGTFSGNTTNNNMNNGVRLGTVNGGTINGNTAIGNTLNGFSITTLNDGTVSGNSANGNTQDGFFFSTIAGGLVDSNTAVMNTDDGFDIDTAFTGGMFNNNTANNNTDQGYEITGAAAPATATNNNGAGNAGNNTFTFP